MNKCHISDLVRHRLAPDTKRWPPSLSVTLLPSGADFRQWDGRFKSVCLPPDLELHGLFNNQHLGTCACKGGLGLSSGWLIFALPLINKWYICLSAYIHLDRWFQVLESALLLTLVVWPSRGCEHVGDGGYGVPFNGRRVVNKGNTAMQRCLPLEQCFQVLGSAMFLPLVVWPSRGWGRRVWGSFQWQAGCK